MLNEHVLNAGVVGTCSYMWHVNTKVYLTNGTFIKDER